MANNYKIEFVKAGSRYGTKYASRFELAVGAAKSLGFCVNAFDRLDTKPRNAIILERVAGDRWEQVATVTAEGVVMVPATERQSVRDMQEQIDELRKKLAEAMLLGVAG